MTASGKHACLAECRLRADCVDAPSRKEGGERTVVLRHSIRSISQKRPVAMPPSTGGSASDPSQPALCSRAAYSAACPEAAVQARRSQSKTGQGTTYGPLWRTHQDAEMAKVSAPRERGTQPVIKPLTALVTTSAWFLKRSFVGLLLFRQ